MQSIYLRKMNEEEFSVWKAHSRKNYAKEKESEGYSPEDALELSDKSFSSLLSEGIHSQDQHLYTVVDTENLKAVGILWWGLQKQGKQKLPWIYDIEMKEEYRGKGYGRLAMLAAEKDVKEKGYHRLGLHVFGHNKSARALYESLNYQTKNVIMQKDL
jgi:ribosomal protein S18 acetylase RimI-like enzyme